MSGNGGSGSRDGRGKAAAGREGRQQEGRNAQPAQVPMSTVVRMMRRVLAAHATKISYPAKTLATSCAAEFLGAVVREADKLCGQEERTVLTPEDLAVSLRNLGLDRYVEPMGIYLRRYREAAARNGAGASASGTRAVDELTDDELLAILGQMLDEDAAAGDGSA